MKTNRRRAKAASTRLPLPALLTQPGFEQVLVLTYGADLEFYERVLRRHFASFRNQIVLADAHRLDETLTHVADPTVLRHMNKTWVAAAVRVPIAAHAKALLLAGPEAGLLLVGSGNMNLQGYAHAGECFVAYRWAPDAPGALNAFRAVRSLTDGLVARGLVEAVAAGRLKAFWEAYEWLQGPATDDSPVRHNLDTPLGDQLVAAVANEPVDELTLFAPFHDERCEALDRLARQLRPKALTILVQRERTSVDPDRLARVLRERRGEARAIEAAGEFAAHYLHAKIIAVKTPTRAVVLAGSANLSLAALWLRQPEANIEMGVLAMGNRDDFDYLFGSEVVAISEPEPTAQLQVRYEGGQEVDGAFPAGLRVTELTWSAPELRGTLNKAGVESAAVSIAVYGQQISVAVMTETGGAASTRFTAHVLDDDAVAAIEAVAVVTVSVGEEAAPPAVPFQLERLHEQDRHRPTVDRLREAARLDLDDPDLEQALRLLEDVLAGENVPQWSSATAPRGGSDCELPGGEVRWGDIDWRAVRQHRRYVAYVGGAAPFAPVEGSDLEAYLSALSASIRDLANFGGATRANTSMSEEDDTDDGQVDGEDAKSAVEGATVDDEDDVRVEVQRRRYSRLTRVRTLIRNFVRRNLKALEDTAFRDGAGPAVVLLNAIVLNSLCWLAATMDDSTAGDLIAERLRLWHVLFGSDVRAGGFLGSLDDRMLSAARSRLREDMFDAVLLASITDVWSNIPDYDDPRLVELSDVVRAAATHPAWQARAQDVLAAATMMRRRTRFPDDAVDLADIVWESACATRTDDVKRCVSGAAGASPHLVTTERVTAVPKKGASSVIMNQVRLSCALTLDDAVIAIAAWVGTEELPYYRLVWDGGVGLYRSDRDDGWVYNSAREEQRRIESLAPLFPPYRAVLDALHADVADLLAKAA